MQPLTVPGTLESLSTIGKYVMEAAAEAGIEKKRAYQLRLAVDEIATNIVVHGYQEAGLSGNIDVSAEITPSNLTIVVEDTALEFDPRQMTDPDSLEKPLEERGIGGLGVYLAIRGVDEFQYAYVDNRNRNIFIVRRAVARAEAAGA